MRKIALRGLLGRRRDTALLWSVVLLAFLFLVLSTVLITSLQETDKVQQLQTYGSWQVLAAGLTGEEANTLAAQAGHTLVVPLIPASGAKFFDGDNEYYLTHLADGTYNRNGCLFVDCENAFDFSDDNTLIYGHHM